MRRGEEKRKEEKRRGEEKGEKRGGGEYVSGSLGFRDMQQR